MMQWTENDPGMSSIKDLCELQRILDVIFLIHFTIYIYILLFTLRYIVVVLCYYKDLSEGSRAESPKSNYNHSSLSSSNLEM